MLQLIWNKCLGDVWCRLATVNLGHAHFSNMYGVYVIWHGGPNPRTVKVGRGMIRDELAHQRLDPQVQNYALLDLFVTWASVAPNLAPAAEAFVASSLAPLIATPVSPTTTLSPVVTTLPW